LNIEPARIEEVIAEAVDNRQAIAREAGVTIQTEISGVPPLFIDRGKMRQVFENLIENAAQHSASGSALRIFGGVIALAGRDWFECRVEDNGPGFSPANLDRVFEPFFTQRAGGTGLGLSIVQRIMEQHSGRVAAGNRPEGGAVITMQLPIA